MKNRRKMILTLIILLAVGFATVSTTLVINGIVGIATNEDDFDVIFTDARLNGANRKRFISENKKVITYQTNKLTKVDEEAILDYEITNKSILYDADVEIQCSLEENSGYEDYITMEYNPKSMKVLAGETKSGSVTAKLMKASTEDHSVSITCELVATATEREELGSEYIEPFTNAGTMIAAVNEYKTQDSIWKFRSNITKVEFENKMIMHETTEELTFDITEEGSVSPVMAYLVPNGETLTTTKDTYGKNLEDTTTYTLFITSDTGVKANSNSSNLFYNFNNLKEIVNLKYLDTSNVTNMSYMFFYCKSLKKIDVSNFDTSNVTAMSFMFFQCNNLTTLDVSNFNTSNVTTMEKMFGGCENLTTLDVSKFDIGQVINTSYMFETCYKLTALDVSKFNTSQVKYMYGMFYYCKSLKKLDVNNFDTSKVTNMNSMFTYCESLTTLDVSNFDTSNVTNMRQMFYGCSGLTTLDLSNFNTSNVTTIEWMFRKCSSLTTLDLSNFDTSKVTSMWYTFEGCSKLETLNISSFNVSKLPNAYASTGQYIFANMPDNSIVYVKDETVKTWLLNLRSCDFPSAWNENNVIIAPPKPTEEA